MPFKGVCPVGGILQVDKVICKNLKQIFSSGIWASHVLPKTPERVWVIRVSNVQY